LYLDFRVCRPSGFGTIRENRPVIRSPDTKKPRIGLRGKASSFAIGSADLSREQIKPGDEIGGMPGQRLLLASGMRPSGTCSGSSPPAHLPLFVRSKFAIVQPAL